MPSRPMRQMDVLLSLHSKQPPHGRHCRNRDFDGVVVEAKYSNPRTLIAAGSKQGVCCFYLNGNDRESHKRVLGYMLENGLIRKTKTGKLYNISFGFDSETYAGKYKGAASPER